jgi:hypothetical protein
MKKERTQLGKQTASFCSIYSEPDFVSSDPYQFRMFSAVLRRDRVDVAPCYVWDETRQNAWLLLLILKSRCAKQYFILQSQDGEVIKVCVDRQPKYRSFIPDPSIPVNLELVALQLKQYFTTSGRKYLFK